MSTPPARTAWLVIAVMSVAVPGEVARSSSPESQPASRPTSAPRPALRARVDARIELFSIIFRLAGNPEYNMPSTTSPYAFAVDKHFGRFAHHPAILKARELRSRRGIAFDAVTSLAVHVTDADQLEEKIPFDASPARLDRRWKADDAREFLELVRQFSRESGFAEFVAEQRPVQVAAAIRMNAVLRRYDIRRWLDEYYGTQPEARYEVLVGLLTGNMNYGMSVQFSDGSEEITPVIGCAHFDEHGIPVIDDGAWLPVIVHEFCHPYSNPLFEKNPAPFERAGKALLARHRDALRAQAYGSWEAVICETLVRASVIRYLETNHGSEVAQHDLREQEQRSFKWVGGLADELARYERQRDRYPTFEDFMPEIVKYLDAYVARTARSK